MAASKAHSQRADFSHALMVELKQILGVSIPIGLLGFIGLGV